MTVHTRSVGSDVNVRAVVRTADRNTVSRAPKQRQQQPHRNLRGDDTGLFIDEDSRFYPPLSRR